MSFPSKEDRLNCWGSRDEYWKCLDTKSETECTELRKQYEKFCSPQWVKHFDRKRDYLKFKEKIEQEGYVDSQLPKRTA
ncbi:cytochrome c oxidase assembly factor 6 homolog [Microplitis demolitor]|uniref:cytochrome c oxidase assembly factor 6 homolog n=1 Tax=Microplitis demolitor TaxID=69319 RepID=UPI0004CD1924|nr:cytochrome c oxidase assembly factor 6 homolog [Microplitis demolitor]